MQTLDWWNMLLLYMPFQNLYFSSFKVAQETYVQRYYALYKARVCHGEAFCYETVHSKNLSLLFFIFIAGLELIHYSQGELKRHKDIS